MDKFTKIAIVVVIGVLFALVGMFFILVYLVNLAEYSVNTADNLIIGVLGFGVLMLSILTVIKIESSEVTKNNLEINKKLLNATNNTNLLLNKLVSSSEEEVVENKVVENKVVEDKVVKKEKTKLDIEIDCLVNDINKLKNERIKITSDVNRMEITNQINELTIEKNALKINEISKKEAIQKELDVLNNNKNKLDLQLRSSENEITKEIAVLEKKLEILNKENNLNK